MSYISDLTDSQWELIKNLLPIGCNAKIDRRALINAVFYVNKAGCQWRMLPKSFPKWTTVYSFFRRNEKAWRKIMDALTSSFQENQMNIDESVVVVDSQSVKTNSRFEKKALRGMRSPKWASQDPKWIPQGIKGVKRSIAVDKHGNILSIDITNANEHDSKIGVRMINDVISRYKNIDIVIADKGFRGTCVNYVNDVLGKIIHIGNKIRGYSRNIVERVFGWFTHYNRLNKCYEHTISSAKSMVVIASIMIMLKRL